MRKTAFIFMLITVALSAAATLPFQGFGPFITLTRFAAIPMVFFWLLYRISELKIRRFNPTIALGIILYLWIFLSSAWSPDLDSALQSGTAPITGFVIALIAWDLSPTKEDAFWVCQCLIYGVYMTFLYMLLQYFKGNEYYNNRFGGAAFDPNEVAFYCAMLMPVAWYMANAEQEYSRYNRFLNLLYPAICFATLLLTASRGGFVTAVPAFIYVFITIPRGLRDERTRKPLIYALSISGAALVLLIVKTGVADYAVTRFVGIKHSVATDKLSGRATAWHYAVLLWEKNPLFGTGLGGFRDFSLHFPMEKVYDRLGQPVHNTPLGILSDYGLIGFGLYLSMIGSTIIAALKSKKELRLAILFFIFIFVLGSMDISEELRQQFYVFYFIIAGLVYTTFDQDVKEERLRTQAGGALRKTKMRVAAMDSPV